MKRTDKVKAAAAVTWEKSRSGALVAVRGAGRALDKAKRSVTQQDAFEAYNAVLDDLTQAVILLNDQVGILRSDLDRLSSDTEEGWS